MKVVVVYYSLTGNTMDTAEKISAALSADIIRLEPEKAYPDSGFKKFLWGGKSAVMAESPKLKRYEFDASAYETVIFGTPIWAGTFAPPLRTFINENKDALKDKKTAVFTCSSGGGAQKAIDRLCRQIGVGDPAAQLSLIDPKVKPSDENDCKIDEFCKAIIS